MDVSEHTMITRSMKKKMEEEGIYSPFEEDEIDENGNLKGLIDYECEEDFDPEMFQRELKRLGGSRMNSSPTKKKKKGSKKKNDKLSDIFLSYILMNALTKPDKKVKKKKSINSTASLVDWRGEQETLFSEYEDEGEETNIEFQVIDEYLSEEDGSDISLDETESSDEEEYDDYDDKFMDLIENDLDEGEELNYFHQFNEEQKKGYLSNLEEINQITKTDVPLRFKILESDMDIKTKSIAITNVNKLNEMDVSTGEYYKMDKWINGLIKIPFGKYIHLPINNEHTSEERREYLMKTQKILDKAIYGHEDAKMHILQVIGKWIRNPNSQGNVLGIQGPMGNGKTTLVKDGISSAIGRPFAFIALGGASDSAYFDGHSYTYEGSHWGRIIDILIDSKCMNPIIYFDELDKVSETYKGDEIIHLLTHLTDPSQNSLFQDNYFPGIHLDLSKALFIFSFNDELKIDRILKDRMYVINTKGFKPEDKISICRNYLLPELMETFLFKGDDLIISDETILYIIDRYTGKEEGVRNLKRCLETIISKINIYNLSQNGKESEENVKMNFKIKEFALPLTVTIDIVQELLSVKSDNDKPPEHMYM